MEDTALKEPSSSLFSPAPIDGLFSLLHLSVQYLDTELARAVHACFLKLQVEDTRLGNALISAYLKLGLVRDAYRVFLSLSCPNIVSYTALISGFAKSNREVEAINLFFRMRSAGIEPNEYSFVALLTACIRILHLELGLQVHSLVIKMGFVESVFVANALMGLYGKFCGYLDHVFSVFDEMPQRDITSWNTVLSSVVKESMHAAAFDLFQDMQRNIGFRLDCFTLSALLTACAGTNSFMKGQEVHAHAIRIGLEANLSVNNALIGFYSECGKVKDVVTLFERMQVKDVITWTEMVTAYMEFGLLDMAVEIFEKMPEKNCVSYNALLAGFCRNGEGLKSLELFVNMVENGLELTDFTLTSVVRACGLLMESSISEQIHGFCMKFGFGSNARIEAALLDMCTKCGRMSDAERIFCRWPSDWNNSIICTSMVSGYARNGLPDDALSLFHHCQAEGNMIVDEVSVTSILSVCGTLGFHEMGEQIHCYALKAGLLSDVGVGNSVISMYSKCCNIDNAIKAFNIMPKQDIVSWNSLIAGHLVHRQGDEALVIWSRMKELEIKSDAVSFALVISAYRHTESNLVASCLKLFHSMKNNYGIDPTLEHYASLVGVLGHWGLLDEAEEIIRKMPFKPDASVLRALLDGCRIHLNITIGKRVAKHILALEPQDPSTYILVSNLYSASGRWHYSEVVRQVMREKGFRKHPARSWIIHRNKVHSFYTRDKSHPQEKDIYSGLDILILECLKAGYVPDTSFVLQEVEEHQKKNFLFYHSAKLAATYGLLMTSTREPVRIMKNILICGDCHTFLKYVSIVTRRDIFVRDSSGFHHFVNGQCSCKDHW